MNIKEGSMNYQHDLNSEMNCEEKKELTIDGVLYLNPFGDHIMGSLELTNYYLIHVPEITPDSGQSQIKFTDASMKLTQIPLGAIFEVRKMGGAANMRRQENSYGLEIICKDFRELKFAFKSENHSRREIVEKLQKLAFPLAQNKDPPGLIAFTYGKNIENRRSYWDEHSPLKQFQKLAASSKGKWKITDVNVKYAVCDTYPPQFVVPSTVKDELLVEASKYRSKGRLASLCWLHENGASITRCSQPLSGVNGKRSTADEEYLNHIREANSPSSSLYIYDSRPQLNARANKAMGGGIENTSFYKNTTYEYLNIQNIHVMRESQWKLHDLCFNHAEEPRWLSSLDQTMWLSHIKCILLAAGKLADKILNNISVVVHCSDGWDRTSQMTSLSMLMLDTNFRTIAGFQTLVEQEWICFGHKFAHRCGQGDSGLTSERSPVFLQFIDCVWQMTQQFRDAFEFNEEFLKALLDHLYSCKFGNFLFNNFRERQENCVFLETGSVWQFLESQPRQIFLNPLYKEDGTSSVRQPQYLQAQLKLWTNYYIRWNPRLSVKSSATSADSFLVSLITRLNKQNSKVNY